MVAHFKAVKDKVVLMRNASMHEMETMVVHECASCSDAAILALELERALYRYEYNRAHNSVQSGG